MEKFKEKQKFQLGKVIYVKSKFNIKQRRKGLSFKKRQFWVVSAN